MPGRDSFSMRFNLAIIILTCSLDMPKVTYTVNNSDIKITINYPKSQNEDASNKVKGIWAKIQAWFKGNLNGKPEEKAISAYQLTTPEQVVEGIRDEYCSMKKDDKNIIPLWHRY